MDRHDYMIGSQILGAALPSSGGPYLVMHINDPGGLVAHEKGSGTSWAVMSLIPNTVTAEIYRKVKEQMQQQFKEKGSDVTIDIVDARPFGDKPKGELVTGLVVGAGVGFALTKLVGHFLKGRG